MTADCVAVGHNFNGAADTGEVVASTQDVIGTAPDDLGRDRLVRGCLHERE